MDIPASHTKCGASSDQGASPKPGSRHRARKKKKHNQGSHEIEVLGPGPEASESSHAWKNCTKNPGHAKFIPVAEFGLGHLPAEYRCESVLDTITAFSVLTVRLTVKYTSWERPDGYTFCDHRGSRQPHDGSGCVRHIRPGKGPCPCSACSASSSPCQEWYKVFVQTACHVVYNLEEAASTTVEFFYDDVMSRYDGRVRTLAGLEVGRKYEKHDNFLLVCPTHDGELAMKIKEALSVSGFIPEKPRHSNKAAPRHTDNKTSSHVDYTTPKHSDNATPELMDNAIQQTDNTIQQTDNTIQQTDNTIQQTDNTIQQTDNTIQQTDNTIQQTDNTIQQTDNTIQQTDNTIQQKDNTNQQTDITIQPTDNTIQQKDNTNQQTDITIQPTDNTIQQQDNTIQQTDNAIQHTDNATFKQDEKAPDRVIVVVSHPHGQPKQVSVGDWVRSRDVVGRPGRQGGQIPQWCEYTTDTCPGSSGAPVLVLSSASRGPGLAVHSGYNEEEKVNYSAVSFFRTFDRS